MRACVRVWFAGARCVVRVCTSVCALVCVDVHTRVRVSSVGPHYLAQRRDTAGMR